MDDPNVHIRVAKIEMNGMNAVELWLDRKAVVQVHYKQEVEQYFRENQELLQGQQVLGHQERRVFLEAQILLEVPVPPEDLENPSYRGSLVRQVYPEAQSFQQIQLFQDLLVHQENQKHLVCLEVLQVQDHQEDQLPLGLH